jgi:hypothetical protein
MDFKDLQQVNDSIKTIELKGNQYAMVSQRVKAFRQLFPEGEISTELLSNENGMCIFKARILVRDAQGEYKQLATGHAYEKEAEGFINKTSYIENCETSAIGRALAMCGIGIDTDIASAEEVADAIKKHDDSKQALAGAVLRTELLKKINECENPQEMEKKVCTAYKVEKLSELTLEQVEKALKRFK